MVMVVESVEVVVPQNGYTVFIQVFIWVFINRVAYKSIYIVTYHWSWCLSVCVSWPLRTYVPE